MMRLRCGYPSISAGRRVATCLLVLIMLASGIGFAGAQSTKLLIIATQDGQAALALHLELDMEYQLLTLLYMHGGDALGDGTVATCYAGSGASGLSAALEPWVETQYTVTLRLESAATVIDLLSGVPLTLNEQERIAYGVEDTKNVNGAAFVAFFQDALDGTPEQRRRLMNATDAALRKLADQPPDQLLAMLSVIIDALHTNMPLAAMATMLQDLVELRNAPLVLQSLSD